MQDVRRVRPPRWATPSRELHLPLWGALRRAAASRAYVRDARGPHAHVRLSPASAAELYPPTGPCVPTRLDHRHAAHDPQLHGAGLRRGTLAEGSKRCD